MQSTGKNVRNEIGLGSLPVNSFTVLRDISNTREKLSRGDIERSEYDSHMKAKIRNLKLNVSVYTLLLSGNHSNTILGAREEEGRSHIALYPKTSLL